MAKKKATKAEKVAKKATGFAVANPTLLIAAVGIPIALYFVYKIGKKIDNAGINTDLGTDAGGNFQGDQSKASISNSQAQMIASSVYSRINKTCLTNKCLDTMLDHALEALAPIKSMKDYALISNAFGTPRFDGYAEAWPPFPQRNMTYWLQTKFRNRPEKYELLKQIIPNI